MGSLWQYSTIHNSACKIIEEERYSAVCSLRLGESVHRATAPVGRHAGFVRLKFADCARCPQQNGKIAEKAVNIRLIPVQNATASLTLLWNHQSCAVNTN